MTVFENIRCGLLWSRGYRYSFWHLLGRQKALNEEAERLLERLNLSDRRNVRRVCCPMPSSARWRSASPSPAAPRSSCSTSRPPA